MSIPAVLSYAAAYLSVVIAAAALVRDRHSLVPRIFAGGMLLFALEAFFRAFSYGAALPLDVIYWQKRTMAVSALIPGVWLSFSAIYARINYSTFLKRWKWSLVGLATLPAAAVVIFRHSIFAGSIYFEDAARWSIPLGWSGRALEFFSILVSVLILFDLERTVRSAIGRVRWQIKFVALGIGGLFALRIYLDSQALLFSTVDGGLSAIGAVGLLAANILFALSLTRGRALNVDLYLSTGTIQNSLTIILAGVYLLSVGVLANLARNFWPNASLPAGAFVVFVSLTALAVLLLSNRLRRKLRLFVSRHFRRPMYDYRNVWMELTQRTTSLVDVNELCAAASRVISESLDVLSVSVWLVDESQRRLTLGGSTAISGPVARDIEKAGKSAAEFIQFLQQEAGCVDFELHEFRWRNEIMQAGTEFFSESTMRYAVSLNAGGELVGIVTLNDDRVGGEKTLSYEDQTLLETLAAQLAASLLNLKLSARLRHAKEVETFQTVSTFFVHDLKNLASRLSLTMQNLPANFHNAEFRADALRVISASVTKIDDMCERLAMLRENIELHLGQCDLNQLISQTLEDFKGNLRAELRQDLQRVPKALIDAEQIHKVLTNLVMNANEAVNGNGLIQVSTIYEGNAVGFAVRDNGCGMSGDFIEKSLFRPFQTTKKKGLGIGLFHSKLIVEAHRGTVEVNSSVGSGTEFRVLLPIG